MYNVKNEQCFQRTHSTYSMLVLKEEFSFGNTTLKMMNKTHVKSALRNQPFFQQKIRLFGVCTQLQFNLKSFIYP